MYAIFEAKGKQFRAEEDARLRLPTLAAEPGQTVTFDRVLLAERDGEVLVGRPAVAGASVAAEVLRHGKGEKIIVFKMKRRKGYRRKQGHRQRFTEVRVVSIDLEGDAGPGKGARRTPRRAEVGKTDGPAAPAEPAEPEVAATDSARALAEEQGIDLTTLEGTGKEGRILKGDVERALRAREESDGKE